MLNLLQEVRVHHLIGRQALEHMEVGILVRFRHPYFTQLLSYAAHPLKVKNRGSYLSIIYVLIHSWWQVYLPSRRWAQSAVGPPPSQA